MTFRSVPWPAFAFAALIVAAVGFVSVVDARHDGETGHDGIPVRIQLKWFHQFQFAGYYAAQKNGYFAEKNLNVELIAGGPEIDPVAAVTDGRAEFGVGNSTLLIDRSNGKPVVAVAAIFQESPFVIVARRDDELVTEKNLEGRTLMAEAHAAEIFAYLRTAGVDLDKVEVVPHTGSALSLAADDPSGIDAATAYTSTEPYEAIHANIPFRVFNPSDIGINFYGDTLFTSEAFAGASPDVVAAVRDAVIKGWAYARDRQDEIITYILDNHETQIDRLHMGFEAQVIHDLLVADLIDIGYMSEARWSHIAQVFEQVGMIKGAVDMDGFLFAAESAMDPTLTRVLIVLAVLFVAAALIAQRFYTLNKSLKAEVHRRTELQAELERLATTDPLTGLANRRRLQQWTEEEIRRARRTGRELALIVFDLDGFKPINDRHGHASGDACLSAVGEACRSVLRTVDLAARLGGDEFAVLLPETDAKAAEIVLSRLRAAIAGATVKLDDGGEIRLRASFGLDFLREDDAGYDDVAQRADAAMYAAKAGQARSA